MYEQQMTQNQHNYRFAKSYTVSSSRGMHSGPGCVRTHITLRERAKRTSLPRTLTCTYTRGTSYIYIYIYIYAYIYIYVYVYVYVYIQLHVYTHTHTNVMLHYVILYYNCICYNMIRSSITCTHRNSSKLDYLYVYSSTCIHQNRSTCTVVRVYIYVYK